MKRTATTEQPLASKSFNRQTRDAALSSLLSGDDADIPQGGTAKKRRRASPSIPPPPSQPPELIGLADFLLQRRQEVTLDCGGVRMTGPACVHVDMDSAMPSITLVYWGDNALDLQITDETPAVHITLADGRIFDGVFLGSHVRLGLRGCIISFTLTSND